MSSFPFISRVPSTLEDPEERRRREAEALRTAKPTAVVNPEILRVPSPAVEPPVHVDDEMAENLPPAFNAGAPRVPSTVYADPKMEHAMGTIAPKRIASEIPPPLDYAIDEYEGMKNTPPGSAPDGLPVKARREPEPTRSVHHGGKGDSRLSDGLQTFLAALAAPQQSTGNGKQDFFNRLGAGAGGFGVGMFNPQLAHDLQYRKDLALYDERQNRENEIERRDYNSRKLESDLADAETDRGYRNAMVKNILTDNEQRALDAKNKNAAEVVKLAQRQRTRVPKAAVVGTAFESFADAIPKADANLEEILKAAQFGFVPNAETQAALGATLGGSFPDGFGKVAPERVPSTHWFVDPQTGEIKAGTVDKEGNPIVKTPGGDARLNPKPASTKTEDTKIWNDKKAFEASKEDLHNARSRVSQLQAVVNALEKGDSSPMPNLPPELAAMLASSDTGETKIANAKAALQKARDDETAIKNRLSVYMDDKTREHKGRWKARWDGEWPAVDIADGAPVAPTRAASNAGKVFPASKLKQAAREAKMSEISFRQKLANDGVTIDEAK
jgi:hypothetical protein